MAGIANDAEKRSRRSRRSRASLVAGKSVDGEILDACATTHKRKTGICRGPAFAPVVCRRADLHRAGSCSARAPDHRVPPHSALGIVVCIAREGMRQYEGGGLCFRLVSPLENPRAPPACLNGTCGGLYSYSCGLRASCAWLRRPAEAPSRRRCSVFRISSTQSPGSIFFL